MQNGHNGETVSVTPSLAKPWVCQIIEKIDREKLQRPEDLHNEIGKLEYLSTKKNKDTKKTKPSTDNKTNKTPCKICKDKEKDTRFHPEDECWFKDQNKQGRREKNINNIAAKLQNTVQNHHQQSYKNEYSSKHAAGPSVPQASHFKTKERTTLLGKGELVEGFTGRRKQDKKAWLCITRVADSSSVETIKKYVALKLNTTENEVIVTELAVPYQQKDSKCFTLHS
ncbi:hypothetical protein HHI36_018366 [Cryptolaemus montrouzieri]|uniref:Uncharacterized protein n=1 Tax=Cryptolaemus montrouzieri TaxID=559131 RepID=A0ABD2P0M5_9CUCU